MTVKELIKKLEKCDPEATVCVDVCDDWEAKVVKQYKCVKGRGSLTTLVCICDSTEYVDQVITMDLGGTQQ